MRVLTVRQPWAWAIVHGGKDVENRVRNIAGEYRGPVAIHAALNPNPGPWWASIDPPLDQVSAENFGAIIGVVDLVGVHEGHNTESDRMRAVRSCFRPEVPFGPCSVWAEPDAWHLVLANARPLREPIQFRGALGLRTLTDDVAAAVLAGVS